MAKYRDTRLEATGAEFLVLAHLLMEGIEAHKSYVNYPGYDVVAVNAAKERQCRIQVKSRYYSSDRAFLIKNFRLGATIATLLQEAT